MSDLVEHARTSHLSLIVICVAVLVALSADNTGGAARAYQQLLTVERLADMWNNGWLERVVEATIKRQRTPPILPRYAQLSLPRPSDEWRGTGNVDPAFAVANAWSLGRTVDSEDELPTITASDLSAHGSVEAKQPVQIPLSGTYQINTLAEFARIWNLLKDAADVRYAEVLKDGYFIRRVNFYTDKGLVTKDLVLEATLNHERSAFESVPGALPRGTEDAELLNRTALLARIDDNPQHFGALPAVVRRLIEHDAREQHYYLIHRVSDWILLRVDAPRINTDVQRAWRFTLPSAPPSGTYEESFPDLAEHTKRVDRLNFDTLGRHLSDEVARARSDVDLGIAKMPDAALATWGMLVVIAVWVYVLLHVVAVRDERAPAASWILLSRRRGALILAALSLTILPAATVTILVVRGIKDSAHLSVRVIVIIGACIAALVLFHAVRTVVGIPRCSRHELSAGSHKS